MMGGNDNHPSGYGQGGSGYGGGFGRQPQTNAFAAGSTASNGYQAPNPPTSPHTYGTEYAHSHTHDTDPFIAASSQVTLDIETLTLSYRDIRDATQEINTPRDTVEFRQTLYVTSILVSHLARPTQDLGVQTHFLVFIP